MEKQAIGEEALHLAGAVATIIVGDIALGRDDQGVGKATSPKRMIFVAFCVFLTFFIIAFFSVKDLLFKSKR